MSDSVIPEERMEMSLRVIQLVEEELLKLPCHFSWDIASYASRSLVMNKEELELHIEESVEGSEVKSYNLKGYYETKAKHFAVAKECFQKALQFANEEDEKIVSYANLAWLPFEELKDSASGGYSELEEIVLNNRKAQDIMGPRASGERIPKVLAEKAFAITKGGFSESGYEEAYRCINQALGGKPDSLLFKFTRAFVYQRLCRAEGEYKPEKELQRSSTGKYSLETVVKLWEDIKDASHDDPEYSTTIHAHALIQYAIALNRTRMDYGKSGLRYIDEAMLLAGSNNAILRNVVDFLLVIAGWRVDIFRKADEIAQRLPETPRSLQMQGRICFRMFCNKKVGRKEKERCFERGIICLQKSWNGNRNDVISAFKLIDLYKEKFKQTNDTIAINDADDVFHELFLMYEEYEEYTKARLHGNYGVFLKMFSKPVADCYLILEENSPEKAIQTDQEEKFSEGIKWHENSFLNTSDESFLEEALASFREVLSANHSAPSKEVYRMYRTFLNTYGKELAFYHLKRSLEIQPRFDPPWMCKYMKELVDEMAKYGDATERAKGLDALRLLGASG